MVATVLAALCMVGWARIAAGSAASGRTLGPVAVADAKLPHRAAYQTSISCAPGPGTAHPARFLGFNYDGSSLTSLPGFDVTLGTGYGGRVGLGISPAIKTPI
ncbi:MAG: hypothetical protein U0166_05255 [Acidobacteriota bacterium]